MIQDIKNIDFYIHKEDFIEELVNSSLISYIEFNDDYYKIDINYKFLERIKKLCKINDDNKYQKYIAYIKYLESKKISMIGMMESILSKELTTSINNEIIKKLKNLK